MLRFGKLSPEAIRSVLDDQSQLGFSYSAVGATMASPPQGYVVDHTRVELGSGEKTFLAARTALERWQQFNLGWLEACPVETPIRVGEVIAVVAHMAGWSWLNTCRIVYVIDESDSSRRFGFAYGTLPDHVESGEERFLLEWDRDQDEIWYDILAFSRPRHWAAKLGYPIVRRTQKRFSRDSTMAMKRAVQQDACPA